MNDSQGKDKPRGQRPAGGRPAGRTGGAPHSGARPARGGKPDEQRLWTKGGAPARGDKDPWGNPLSFTRQHVSGQKVDPFALITTNRSSLTTSLPGILIASHETN